MEIRCPVLSQLLNLSILRDALDTVVTPPQGGRGVHRFRCWNQLVCITAAGNGYPGKASASTASFTAGTLRWWTCA
jgi:hypothetical protein